MKETLVVDLDKTFLKIDTFRSYILFVSCEALKVLRLDICFVLMFFTVLRKVRLISHSTLKYHVLMKSEHFMNESRLNDFVSHISREVNSQVVGLIDEYKRQGFFILLSTAAPINYVSKIKTKFAFDDICATPMPSMIGEWYENVREKKYETTMNYMRKNSLELDTFVTDHYDDMYMLKIVKRRNVLIEPSKVTIERLNDDGILYEMYL